MRLYIGNLSFETTENDLQDLFEQHGTVSEVSLVMDRMTGRSRGFGFVTMGGATEGQAAMTALDGTQVDGRLLMVNEARPRMDSGGGSSKHFDRPQRSFSGKRR